MDKYGNIDQVVKKVIKPQVMSICRIEGSKYGAKEFIEGNTREVFQNSFTLRLHQEAEIRNIDIVIGLVHDIVVPKNVGDPIRSSKIAYEERLTKQEQTKTQMELNRLEELRADVRKGVREVGAVTLQLVAEKKALGEQEVAVIKAQKEVVTAQIDRQTADINAQINRVLGKAEADVIGFLAVAEADRFKQQVQAMGDPKAYAALVFAQGLSEDLKVQIRYAGPGTFWTDVPAKDKKLDSLMLKKLMASVLKENRAR